MPREATAQKPKRGRGQPSPIKEVPEEICRKTTRYLMLGCSHEKVAEILGISVPTFYAWMKKSPDFFKAVKAGEVDADANVASALYQNATGFRRTIEKEVVLKTGNGNEQRVEVVSLLVEEPPNTAAGIFWLKNRQRDHWKDIRANELSGPNGGPISTEMIPVKQLEPEDRAKLRAFLEQHVTDVEDLNEEANDGEDESAEDEAEE